MTDPDTSDNKTSAATSDAAANQAPADNPASGSAAAEATQESSGLADQLAAAKKESADNYSRYLRAVADLENFRKRTVREKDELRQYAASRVLEDLLPALDNLGLGLAAAKLPNADIKTIVGGVEMVLSQLKASLANHGLKEINPVGQPFDPHQHESIGHQPSSEVPAEAVLTVVRTGYSLNGRLLRPASVLLSSGPAAAEAKS
ncbi:protein GrpE [mine drainage metagenome]|uniref:Protein GrpE n=1 Tax=mine drainage metagenome TaxID=410659 RepID=A0A1J5TQT5_9ZZZZ